MGYFPLYLFAKPQLYIALTFEPIMHFFMLNVMVGSVILQKVRNGNASKNEKVNQRTTLFVERGFNRSVNNPSNKVDF